MWSWLADFRKTEDGAVSIDWVLLTAATVGLALAVGYMISTAPLAPAEAIGDALAAQVVN